MPLILFYKMKLLFLLTLLHLLCYPIWVFNLLGFVPFCLLCPFVNYWRSSWRKTSDAAKHIFFCFHYYCFIHYFFVLIISFEFYLSLNCNSWHRDLAILFCDKFEKTYIYRSFLSFLCVVDLNQIAWIWAVERWIQSIKIKSQKEVIIAVSTITDKGVSLTHVDWMSGSWIPELGGV